MKKFDLNGKVNDETNKKLNDKAESAETGYQLPELLEIGRSRDLIQGTSCCGPYDGRGYYPQ